MNESTEQTVDEAFVDLDTLENVVEVDKSQAPPADLDSYGNENKANVDDGSRVADKDAAGDDSIVQFDLHQDSIMSVATSPIDCNKVVSGGCDDKAFMWNIFSDCDNNDNNNSNNNHDVDDDTENDNDDNKDNDSKQSSLKPEHIELPTSHTDSVIGVGFSAKGDYIATAGMDGNIFVLNSQDGKLKATLEGPAEELEWFSWHPRGYVIAAGSADTTVWLWNAKSGTVMRVFAGHLATVLCGAWTGDGKLLVTGSEDGSAYVWSPKTGGAEHHLKGETFHDGPITCCATHPSKPIFATGSADRSIFISSVTSGKTLQTLFGHEDNIESLSFAPVENKTVNNNFLASASLDGSIRIWDLTSGQCRLQCEHGDGVVKIEFHPTHPYIVSAGMDCQAKLWDIKTGKLVQVFRGHVNTVMDASFTCDAKYLVTCSDDGASLVFPVKLDGSGLPPPPETATTSQDNNTTTSNTTSTTTTTTTTNNDDDDSNDSNDNPANDTDESKTKK